MGARVFHHPLAIRVYEWVEIRGGATVSKPVRLAIRVYEWVEIARNRKNFFKNVSLQSVYMSGLKYLCTAPTRARRGLQSVYMSGLKSSMNTSTSSSKKTCNPCI